MNDLDHARCSELLGAYARGLMDAPTASAVDAHMEGCERCRSELAGLRALAVGAADPLTDLERTRLRRQVRAQLEAAGRKPLWQRLGPALGAAALVALMAVGAAAYLGLGGGESDRGAAGLQSGDEADRGAGAGPEAPAEVQAAEMELGPPVFDVFAGARSQSQLQALGRRAFESGAEDAGRTSANAAAGDFAGYGWRRSRLEALAALAPDEGVADQIRRCGAVTLAQLPGAVPSYGALGRYDGRPALILGFVRARSRGPLPDRYTIWVWPRGSCDVPLDFMDGKLVR